MHTSCFKPSLSAAISLIWLNAASLYMTDDQIERRDYAWN